MCDIKASEDFRRRELLASVAAHLSNIRAFEQELEAASAHLESAEAHSDEVQAQIAALAEVEKKDEDFMQEMIKSEETFLDAVNSKQGILDAEQRELDRETDTLRQVTMTSLAHYSHEDRSAIESLRDEIALEKEAMQEIKRESLDIQQDMARMNLALDLILAADQKVRLCLENELAASAAY